MATIQQLVDQLSTGGSQWKIIGNGAPVEETAPVAVPADAANLTPATTVNRGTGRYYVTVQDAEGHQRALFLKPDPIATAGPGSAPSAIQVRQSGVNDTDPSQVISDPEKLKTLSWSSGGPVGDVPAGQKEPSPTSALVAIDAKGNEVPKGDPSAKQLRDNKTGTTFNLVTDPAGTLHDLGNDVILVKPDGSYTKVATKPEEAKQLNVPGVGLVDYDPKKPEGSQYTVAIGVPTDVNNLGGVQVRNGKSYVPNRRADGTVEFLETNLPAQQDIGYTLNEPNSRYIKFFDKQGNLISQTDKGEDWKPPVNVQPGTAPAADLVAPNVPTFDPQTGQLKFTPNENQVKASAATEELAKQLGLKVAAGSMSEKQAQDIISGAINTMNAQTSRMTAEQQQNQTVTTAAGDILSNTRGNAQTAAGMLQQRAQAATGTLQSIVGNALSNKNITSIPGDVGANLVGGLQGWTADLMGGQATMDSAARMVQAADPQSNLADPTTQAAISTLRQMLDKHAELTGQPHPAVAATQAAQQSQQTGGMVVPGGYNPADIQWNQPSQNAPGRTMGPGGVITGPQPVQAVAPIQPVPVASGFQAPMGGTVPGQKYGPATAYTGGIAPWLAQPQPAFVAPMPPPLTAQMVLGGR